MTESRQSDNPKRVVVLSVCDQFGRMLQADRFAVDLAQMSHLQGARYLLPCKIVDGQEFTIELFARLDVLKVK